MTPFILHSVFSLIWTYRHRVILLMVHMFPG
jgi:hypothetical protein